MKHIFSGKVREVYETDDPEGRLALADEVLTPDSSRFWPADQWQPGRPQRSFDKQIVRDWLDSPEAGCSGGTPSRLRCPVMWSSGPARPTSRLISASPDDDGSDLRDSPVGRRAAGCAQ